MLDPKVHGAIESGNNPLAVGPMTRYGQAKGSMQVLDDVAKNPGYGVKPARDDSIEERDRVGRDLSAAWSAKYGDTVGLVAYNWGPGNTDKWIKRGMKWSELPKETQMYVGRYYLERVKQTGE